VPADRTATGPGVNFINVLQAALMLADISKAQKKIDNLTGFFCAFGICMPKSCS